MIKFKYRITSIVFFLFLFCVGLQAQYKQSMNSGKVSLSTINKVTIEGHTGSEVIIEVEGGYEYEKDERAAGLKEINAMGLTDNTGLGLAATKDGNTLKVEALSRGQRTRYIVKVPSGVAVEYENSSPHASTLKIKDVKSEIEVSSNHGGVEVTNASGPIAINTVHGHIDADFSGVNSQNDIKLYSNHGHIDVTVSPSIKADFRLNSRHGKMFTDLNLKMENAGEEGLRSLSNHHITGSLNGGGIDFSITANHSNIYLRKSK